MARKLELKGKRFGKLLVLSEAGRNKYGSVLWLCKCDCGNEKTIVGSSLISGTTKSCGRIRSKNIIEKRFGKLVVLMEIGRNKYNQALWLCRCDCGTYKTVLGTCLIRGITKSCGCLVKETISKRYKGKKLSIEHKQNMSKVRSGKRNSNYKGGVEKDNIPLYDTFAPQFSTNFEETKSIMVHEIKALGVKCYNSNCKKWFVPKTTSVRNRLQSFKGQTTAQNNFYCSDECKEMCSTFNKRVYPKGQNPNKQTERPYTSEQYQLYRKTVLERENYICEYCGARATEVHHEKSQKTDPMFVVDPDYGHAVCKGCHYKYGHKKGTECSTGALARKIC